MAEGLAVALPLYVDPIDGAYGLLKDMTSVAEQNLKMLILTSPGERVMEPNYGVGIRGYLFEQNTVGLQSTLKRRIVDQIATYLPYIEVRDLEVASPPVFGTTSESADLTRINISLTYAIPAVNIVSNLTLPIDV